MEEDLYSPRPVAGWFIIAAAASLLFMGLGCISYLMHVFANPATMPLDQRAAYEAEPAWVTGTRSFCDRVLVNELSMIHLSLAKAGRFVASW